MKVLRIVTTMDPTLGGVVEAINQASIGLTSLGHEVSVLSFDDPDDSWVKDQGKYNNIGLGKSYTSYAFNPSYIKWLLNNAKNYDFVILDGLWQFHIFGGYLLKLLNVPFGVYTHGMLDPYFNENKFKYLKKLPFWFLVERNVLSISNATFFTCEEEKLLASQSFPMYKSKPYIVSLGVDNSMSLKNNNITSFLNEFPNMRSKRFALFLSRIHPKKGIDLLIQAFRELKALPADFDLVIAGPDHDNLKEKLMIYCPPELKNRIHWVGMLTGDIKWGAYHAADCFILPSHQENFGIVVAEALSTSTPVLITNKVNIWREIDNGNAGFVEKDNVEGIERLLSNWLELPEEKKNEMRKNAKLCYQKNFSMESAVESLDKTLKKLCL